MRHLTRRSLRNLLQPLVQTPVESRSRNGGQGDLVVARRSLHGWPPFVIGGGLSISVRWCSSIDALTRSFEHVRDCFKDPLQALLATPYPPFDPCNCRFKKILGFVKPSTTELLRRVRANLVAAFVQIISGDPSGNRLVEPLLDIYACPMGCLLG
jgi:hypothetical protein